MSGSLDNEGVVGGERAYTFYNYKHDTDYRRYFSAKLFNNSVRAGWCLKKLKRTCFAMIA